MLVCHVQLGLIMKYWWGVCDHVTWSYVNISDPQSPGNPLHQSKEFVKSSVPVLSLHYLQNVHFDSITVVNVNKCGF